MVGSELLSSQLSLAPHASLVFLAQLGGLRVPRALVARCGLSGLPVLALSLEIVESPLFFFDVSGFAQELLCCALLFDLVSALLVAQTFDVADALLALLDLVH